MLSSSSQSDGPSSSKSSSEIEANELSFNLRGIKWNSTKPLYSGIPAIANGSILNKQCQIIKIPFTKYTIKYVSLFLGKFHKDNGVSYNLVLEVYDTDQQGLPKTLISSTTLSSNKINNPDWYLFDFGTTIEELTTPDNQLLAFVLYQDGGNDRNYIYWYYSLNVDISTKAYVSRDDGNTWVEQNDITRSIRISDIFDIFSEAYFDSSLHALRFPAGKEAKIILDDERYLNGGDFKNTILKDNKVVIDYKPMVVSLVIDSSGSMGWNDRYFDRIKGIQYLINKLQNKYPKNVLFDILTFGSITIEPLNFNSNKRYSTIKLDLNNPHKYSLNKDGSVPSFTDGLLSWGLKNLQSEHEYIISSIYFSPSNIIIENGRGILIPELDIYAPINYQNVGNQNNTIKFAIEPKGIGSENSPQKATNAVVCNVPLDNTNIIRVPFTTNRMLNTAFVTKDISENDNRIFVNNYTQFEINTLIDIFDQNNIVDNLKIIGTEKVGEEYQIILNKPVGKNFKNSFHNNGCLIQASILSGAFYVQTNDTMIELLIKDAQHISGQTITLFLQTVKGGVLEWDFSPFSEWEALFLFYAGETVNIDIEGYDSYNDPLPDGTKLNLYVDGTEKKFDIENAEAFVKLFQPVKTGDDTFVLYANDLNTENLYKNITKNEYFILRGEKDGNTLYKKYEIINIEQSSTADLNAPSKTIEQKKITFSPIHLEMWDGTHILLEKNKDLSLSTKLDIPISAVDISPIEAGKQLPPELLEPQDPPQVDPTSKPDDFNQDRTRRRNNIINIPLINGIGRIHVLPITEDVLETKSQKDEQAFQFYDNIVLSDKEKIEYENLKNEYLSQTNIEKKSLNSLIFPTQESTLTTTITTDNYTIETPVYFANGHAISHMKSFGRNMQLYSFKNYNQFINDQNTQNGITKSYSDASILATQHIVTPYVEISSKNKIILQKMDPLTFYFMSPLQMTSCVVGSFKTFCKRNGDCFCYKDIPTIYSTLDTSLTIYFNVRYKDVLLKKGTMRVKIFDANRNAENISNPSSQYISLNIEAQPYINNPQKTEEEECSCELTATPLAWQEYVFHDVGSYFIDSEKVKDLQEAVYLPNYPEGGYTLDIVNGRASLNISSSSDINFTAHLKVYAEVLDPTNNISSVILVNTVFIDTPLSIIPYVNGQELTPLSEQYTWAFAQYECPTEDRVLLNGDGYTTYNLGAYITWMGEPIEDNIEVNFISHVHKRYVPNVDNYDNLLLNAPPTTQEQLQKLKKMIVEYQTTNDLSKIYESLSSDNTSSGIWSLWPATLITPNVSKTNKGFAVDAYLGPHGEVAYQERELSQDQKILWGDRENITIKVNYRGMEKQFVVQAMWVGNKKEDEEKKLYITSLIYKNNSITRDCVVWADGWDYALIVLDLAVSYKGGYAYIKEIEPYLCNTLNPINIVFQSSNLNYGKSNFTKELPINPVNNQALPPLIKNPTNIPYGWCVSPPISKAFIPTPPDKPDKTVCQDCYPYDCDKITAFAYLPNEITKYRILLGCWAESEEDCPCEDITGQPTGDYKKPIIKWKEPLEATATAKWDFTPYSKNKLAQDGRHSTRIDVVLSFSGYAIPMIAKKYGVTKFTSDDHFKRQNSPLFHYGLTSQAIIQQQYASALETQDIYDWWWNYYMQQLRNFKQQQTDYQTLLQQPPKLNWKNYFPIVYFDIYLGRYVEETETYEKTRSIPSLTLSQYNVLLNIQYTNGVVTTDNIEIDESLKHFHECNVDEQGNGQTYKTFKKDTYEEIDNHIHTITNFTVNKNNFNGLEHWHNIISSASTYVNPFTIESLGYIEQNEKIIIRIWGEYDASRVFVQRKFEKFLTFDIYGQIVPADHLWKLNLTCPPIAYVQKSTTNNDQGFDISVSLKREDGLLPPDGTRVEIVLDPFLPQDSKNSNTNSSIISLTKEHNYMAIEAFAQTTIENQKVRSQTERINVLSDISCLPNIKKLVPFPTNDNLYLQEALNKIKCIGCSQINDSIVEALSSLKKHYLENKNNNYLYEMFVFTDGDDNMSSYNYSNVIKLLTNGLQFPVYPIGLGQLNATNKKLLNFYATKTGGNIIIYGLNNYEEIKDKINDLLTIQQSNKGEYINIIQLEEPFYITQFCPIVNIPINSKIFMSFQYGNYLNNLSTWSSEYLIINNGDCINIKNLINNTKNKFIKYKVILFGNIDFQSPSFEGCSTFYLQPRYCKVFSQPIELPSNDEGVVSELLITHKALESELLDISYGLSHCDTTREWEYYNDYMLPFKCGQKYYNLSRFNELMTTTNLQTYTAINGPWNKDLPVKIYSTTHCRSFCELINENEYITNPSKGTVTFYKSRNAEEIIICSIEFPKKFRILCKVRNDSEQEATIDHIGLTYNISKTKWNLTDTSFILNLFSDNLTDYYSLSNLSLINIQDVNLYKNNILLDKICYTYSTSNCRFKFNEPQTANDIIFINIPYKAFYNLFSFVFVTRLYPSPSNLRLYQDLTPNEWSFIDIATLQVFVNGELVAANDYIINQTNKIVIFKNDLPINTLVYITYLIDANIKHQTNIIKPALIKFGNIVSSLISNTNQKYNYQYWPPPWELYYSQTYGIPKNNILFFSRMGAVKVKEQLVSVNLGGYYQPISYGNIQVSTEEADQEKAKAWWDNAKKEGYIALGEVVNSNVPVYNDVIKMAFGNKATIDWYRAFSLYLAKTGQWTELTSMGYSDSEIQELAKIADS